MTGNSQTLEPAAPFSTTRRVSAPTDRGLSKGGTTRQGLAPAEGPEHAGGGSLGPGAGPAASNHQDPLGPLTPKLLVIGRNPVMLLKHLEARADPNLTICRREGG
jgi:hypothetical protein